MSLDSVLQTVIDRIAEEFNAVRSEMAGLGGGGDMNVDGGTPSTVYGGTINVDGGTP